MPNIRIRNLTNRLVRRVAVTASYVGVALAPGAASSTSGHVAAQQPPGFRFEVTLSPQVADAPVDGRVILLVTRNGAVEPRFQPSWGADAIPMFGVDVDALAPGRSAVIDTSVRGYPLESIGEIPAGEYSVQAVLNVYTTFRRADGHTVKLHMDQWEGQQWNRSPGNLLSEPVRVRIDPLSGQPVRITLTRKIPPIEPPVDTKYVKHIRFRSEILSDWWGHDMDLGAVVVLPPGFDEHPDARYPVAYLQGHFPRTFNAFRETPPDPDMTGPARAAAEAAHRFYLDWSEGRLPKMLIVLMQHPTPYYDDSYAVNTANNGPYGDALTQELIPRVERRFRAIGEPWARTIYGGSTGGWESLAWQVFYPDMFNGTWTFCPDPVDFRYFQLIDIYRDENAFRPNSEWVKDAIRPAIRGIDDQVLMTVEQFSHFEAVLGSRGRSGEQLDIFNAVFGPTADDGYPRPLYDKWTGEIDQGVVAYWRENYDLRYILERDWQTIGPKLVGKIHIYMGDTDTYYLEEATRLLEQFLESTTDPYYGGSFTWGERQPHCYSGDAEWPGQNVHQRVLPLMAAHLLRTAPRGADTTSWRY